MSLKRPHLSEYGSIKTREIYTHIMKKGSGQIKKTLDNLDI